MDSSIVLWHRNSSCDSNEIIRSAVLEIASAIKFVDIANENRFSYKKESRLRLWNMVVLYIKEFTSG